MSYSAPAVPAPMPVASREDAHVLLARLEASMEGLIELIEAETRLVRDGKLFAAAELEARKSTYARAYVDLISSAQTQEEVLRSILPDNLEKLRMRHDEFKILLQMNLAALATARDVTRNIIKGVANRMGQSQVATTYGAQGRMTPQKNLAAPGITTDKSF